MKKLLFSASLLLLTGMIICADTPKKPPYRYHGPAAVDHLKKTGECFCCDLRGEDLRRAISDANTIAYSKGNYVVLDGANLEYTNLIKASLHSASLVGTKLNSAWLMATILNGADLRRADLGGAILNGVDLREANLRGADLSKAVCTDAKLGSWFLCNRTKFACTNTKGTIWK